MMMPEKDRFKLRQHNGHFIRRLGGWAKYKKWLAAFGEIFTAPRVHKDLRFPYHISIPLTSDGEEETIIKVKTRKEEKALIEKYFKHG